MRLQMILQQVLLQMMDYSDRIEEKGVAKSLTFFVLIYKSGSSFYKDNLTFKSVPT